MGNIIFFSHLPRKRRNAPLLAPSIDGDLDEVKRLIGVYIADYSTGGSDLPSFINEMDDSSSNNAAIHGAIYSGHLDVVQFLVECCALHQGTRGDADEVVLSGTTTAEDDETMVAAAASSTSKTAIVDLLTLKNGLGCAPLWLAAGYDRISCLEYILRQLGHCDMLLVSLLQEGANNVGDTPLLAAASKGNVNVCDIIFQTIEEWYSRRRCGGRGCEDGDGGTNNDDDNNKIECQRMKARVLRLANHAGDTPLQVAVASGHVELVTMLLKVDKSNNIVCHHDDNEITTQDTTTTTSGGVEEIIDDECLLSNSIINVKNVKGLSPLIVACERNYVEIVKLLLSHNNNTNTNIRDTNGRSCLAVASFCGCIDVVTYLLEEDERERGGEEITAATTTSLINAIDNHGRTPVWLAARTGNLAMTQLLVNAGADVTLSDNDMVTPLDVAVKYKKEKVIEYLSSL